MLERVAEALTARGYEVETIAMTGPGSTARQVSEAVGRGAEGVFACGGGGSAHEVLQGLMQAGPCSASLAVLPFGSANALARRRFLMVWLRLVGRDDTSRCLPGRDRTERSSMKFVPFEVTTVKNATRVRSTEVAVSALVVRISELEGML